MSSLSIPIRRHLYINPPPGCMWGPVSVGSLARPLSCSRGRQLVHHPRGSSPCQFAEANWAAFRKGSVGLVGVPRLNQTALAEGGSLSPRLYICPITKTCQDVSKIALLFFPFSPVGQTQTCLAQSPLQDLTCCLAVGVWVATGSSRWLC